MTQDTIATGEHAIADELARWSGIITDDDGAPEAWANLVRRSSPHVPPVKSEVPSRLASIFWYIYRDEAHVPASVPPPLQHAGIIMQRGIFQHVALDRTLEAEVGMTQNEPRQVTAHQAIEKAVPGSSRVGHRCRARG